MKNRVIKIRSRRNLALSRVSAAVVATLVAGGANAADTSFTSDVPAANGNQVVQSIQEQPAPVSASAVNQSVGISVLGVQAGTSNSVSQNAVPAQAVGNTAGNSIDLSLTGISVGGDGVATLGVQTSTGGVASTAAGNTVFLDLDGFASGQAVVDGNTISATTNVNRAASSITGTVPSTYSSNLPGSVNLDTSEGATSSASGSAVVTSIQRATGPANFSASAIDNDIRLDLTTSTANTVSSSPALTNNSVSSALNVNSAQSSISVQPGGAPAFAGSAVVNNLQLSSGTVNTATTSNTSILGSVDSSNTSVNTLAGTLAVQGNRVTSSVTGNEAVGANGTAGNSIAVGDGVAFTGSTEVPSNVTSYTSGMVASSVAADAVVYSSQGNVSSGLTSETGNTVIIGVAQSLQGGSIDLAGNAISSSATGNNASSAIATGSTAATLAAAFGIANQQSNYLSSVSATTDASLIAASSGADDGTTQASTVSVSGNRSAATAYGNSASQSLGLAANAIPLGGTTVISGGPNPDGNVSVTGAASLTNLQSNYRSEVNALNASSVVGLQADSGGSLGNRIGDSTLAVIGNKQEAVAVANSVGNALSLNGNSVGTGAGMANVQVIDSFSPVSATLQDASAVVYAGTHVDNSTLELTGNLQRAIAYGNSAGNTIGVSSTVTGNTVLPGGGSVGTSGGAFVTGASYGLVNNQSVQSGVMATVAGPTVPVPAITVLVEGDVNGSTVRNEANAFIAAAYGNAASNAGSMTLGNATVTGPGTVAAVANTQSVSNAAVVTASATGGNLVQTSIEDNVTGSTVSTSNNTIQATAYGSRTSENSLDVRANNLGGEMTSAVLTGWSSGGFSNAAVTVSSAQDGSGTVTATQRDGTTSAAGIRSTVGSSDNSRDVVSSTLSADANSSTAAATSNSASNSLTLNANTAGVSTGVQNAQYTNSNVNALIGLAGVAGSPGTSGHDFSYSLAGSAVSGTYNGALADTYTVTSGSYTVNTAGFTVDEVAYLVNQGFTLSSGTTYMKAATGIVSSSIYNTLVEGGSVPFVGTVAGTPPTASVPNAGGVTIAISNAIIGSLVSVANNSNSASVTGNSASNASAITASAITGNGSGPALADLALLVADHALANNQETIGGVLAANVYGSFALETTPGATISDSTLRVTGNSQSARAVANTSANALALTAANLVGASAALGSVQLGDLTTVTSASDMEVFAPAAVNGSSVSLSDNRNTSLAVTNDVRNELTATAGSLTGSGLLGQNAFATGGFSNGDLVLSNWQTASGSAASSASTRLYNGDLVAVSPVSIQQSAVTVSGNTTAAEASANRATNSVALNASATQSGNAALANYQTTGGLEQTVSASADTSATVQMPGNALVPAVLNQSSVGISGNSTTALARSNYASNTLDIASGAGSTPTTPLNGASASSFSANATGALSNFQFSAASVNAAVTGAYQVAINTAGVTGVTGATDSLVSVTGNTALAEAYGNSATNRVTVAALNSGTPTAAVANYQVNTGFVTATATSVSYGSNITGAAAGSTLRTAGNTASATAVGNSAISSIAAR